MSALTDARARRDAGMEAAAEAEAHRQPAFAVAAYAAILSVATRQGTLHVDDVLPACSVRPASPNAWGSVWQKAIRDGVIVKTGRTRPCATDRRKHAHEYPVYASGLFGRAAKPTVPGRRALPPTDSGPKQIDLFAGGAS
ncbi:hypothetical protein [Methylobacterium brachiatum]